MTRNDISHGRVRSAGELGQLVRAHRKGKGLTLETVSGLGNLSTRFLSEFERGKETAEIGKILKALRTLGLDIVVRPRGGPTPPARPELRRVATQGGQAPARAGRADGTGSDEP